MTDLRPKKVYKKTGTSLMWTRFLKLFLGNEANTPKDRLLTLALPPEEYFK
jgi:hypothetical protein